MGSSINEIRKRLEDRKNELNLSYQDIADRMKMNKSTIQRYITGDIGNIGLDKLDLLAEVLNTTPEYILGCETNNVIMTIGDKIKEQRIKNGLTQEELGKTIDVSKVTIFKYENNIITNIPPDNIEKLAGILNVTPSYLMGWEESYSIKSKLKKIEVDFPEAVPVLYRATEELTDEEKKTMIRMIQFVFFEKKN